MIRCFQVVQRENASDNASDETGDVVRWECSQPPLSVEVSVGHRYTFEVYALLIDASLPKDVQDPVWTSAASSSVTADLRKAGSVTTRNMSESSQPKSSRRPTVASKLGSFFATQPSITASSSSSVPLTLPACKAESFAQDPNRKPSTQVKETSLAIQDGWCGESEHHEQHISPLNLVRPRTVLISSDPMLEKRKMEDRLLVRSGRLTAESVVPTLSRERLYSSDSDDGICWQGLSDAFNSLERVSTTKFEASSWLPSPTKVKKHDLKNGIDGQSVPKECLDPSVLCNHAQAVRIAQVAAAESGQLPEAGINQIVNSTSEETLVNTQVAANDTEGLPEASAVTEHNDQLTYLGAVPYECFPDFPDDPLPRRVVKYAAPSPLHNILAEPLGDIVGTCPKQLRDVLRKQLGNIVDTCDCEIDAVC